MAIATLTEIKSFLGITDSTKDTIISALIPQLQSDILDECGSNFEEYAYNTDYEAYEGGDTISFTAATKTVTDSDNDLPFLAGQNVYISGSRFNDGHYTIATAGTGSFIVSEDIFDEAAVDGWNISIKLVKFPKALKMILAEYISTKINNKEIGVSSESISGAISTSYFEDGAGMPAGIKKALSKYHTIKVI